VGPAREATHLDGGGCQRHHGHVDQVYIEPRADPRGACARLLRSTDHLSGRANRRGSLLGWSVLGQSTAAGARPTSSVGAENVPEEIWLIKINPTRRETLPVRIDDIIDRRNQLEGNISLFQQLRHVEMLNDMLLSHAFRPEFLD
jgi:hypothetical protein